MDSKKRIFNMVFPTREQFLESCKPQAFSFPIPIMEYIWKNPSSPEVYEKLIKSCKLFFLKNPILVLRNLVYYSSYYGWLYCNSEGCGKAAHEHKYKKLNINNNESKIWVTQRFCVSTHEKSTIASDLIPKIYRSNIKYLELRNQILSYDELKFLAAGVEECRLATNDIKYDDGVEVPLVEVIKLFSGAKSLWIYLGSNSLNGTYADLIDACNAIEYIQMCCAPADFDARELYQQMKRIKSRVSINITSWFNGSVIDEVMDEVLAIESLDFVPPVMIYIGQSKLQKMKEIQAREAVKYR